MNPADLHLQGYDAFIPHFKTSTFVLKYLGIVVFCGDFVFWKLFKGTKRIKATSVDLVTGRQDAQEADQGEEVVSEVDNSHGRGWKSRLNVVKQIRRTIS